MGKKIAVDFQVLPDECITNIISRTLTSPGDACRSSLVSSIFKSIADSDLVWEKFLPSDLKEIISRSVSPVVSSSKKELFLRLCNHPILIDDGKKARDCAKEICSKDLSRSAIYYSSCMLSFPEIQMLVFASKQSFSIEKWSGGKCYMVAARELTIIWGDTPVYWRFSDVAELLDVCWLEIHGKMDTRMLSMKTTYAAYLVFKFRESTYGFSCQPVEVSVRLVGGGGREWHTMYMDPDGCLKRQHQSYKGQVRHIRIRSSHLLKNPTRTPWIHCERRFPQERGDGWMEIEMGEFFNDRGEDGEVEMSLTEVKDGLSSKSRVTSPPGKIYAVQVKLVRSKGLELRQGELWKDVQELQICSFTSKWSFI
ncbi:hypothetical protein HHK36_022381 [Tetracentron sinense]|uniref:F-box domain-containing protein n=1 Tax=Tetracentron sinense TaxID=13715 RepID=A0A835D6Q9_TETSI|nr:hypothetical protein HHK36_022381 [Tetracentron sinense]